MTDPSSSDAWRKAPAIFVDCEGRVEVGEAWMMRIGDRHVAAETVTVPIPSSSITWTGPEDLKERACIVTYKLSQRYRHGDVEMLEYEESSRGPV